MTRHPNTARTLLLLGGKVMGRDGCDAVLIADGQVAQVGRGADLLHTSPDRRKVDGAAILPGFVDGHTHLVESGLVSMGWRLDVSGCGRRDALERIAVASRLRTGGEWLVAAGWDESTWTPDSPLRRSDLDRVASRIPAVAVRVDGHLATVNSWGLKVAQAALRSVEHLVEADAGHVREAAVTALLSFACPDATVIRDALRAGAAACHRLGITTAHVMAGLLDPHLILDAAEGLRLRLVVHPRAELLERLAETGVRSGDGGEWGTWGALKLFADGSIGARTAAVSEPYAGGGRGMLLTNNARLSARIAAAEHAGWQTAIHAIGDRAIELVLDAHEMARSSPEFRHRIEHFELPTSEQLERTARLGLVVCMQPNFVGNWSGAGKLYEAALGSERDVASNPFRGVSAAGIHVGFGSDGMPLSPLYGIDSVVRAPHEGQRMNLDDALYAYTEGGAFLSGRETCRAGIVEGQKADLVVVDGLLDASAVGPRSVALTVVGGEITFDELDCGDGPGSL